MATSACVSAGCWSQSSPYGPSWRHPASNHGTLLSTDAVANKAHCTLYRFCDCTTSTPPRLHVEQRDKSPTESAYKIERHFSSLFDAECKEVQLEARCSAYMAIRQIRIEADEDFHERQWHKIKPKPTNSGLERRSSRKAYDLRPYVMAL